MDEVKFSRAHRILVSIVIIALMAIIFWLVYAMTTTATETSSSKKWVAEHPLLSKRLSVEAQNDILINFAPLREALQLYFSRIDAKYSFYFEYLPTGSSIQIGDNSEMVSASLLKLPLVMDLYKTVELGSTSLDKEVTIARKDVDPLYGSLWKKGAGTKLSLKEAVRLTLVDSDNTAANLLTDEVVPKLPPQQGSFSQLDIPTDKNNLSISVITAKAYSSTLKCLYLSCFLEPEDSQQILSLLALSDNPRIKAGVPSYITVADKIGTFSTEVQSDCGIIYVPKRPYLMCMMVGSPEDKADPQISAVSKLIYDYVNGQSH